MAALPDDFAAHAVRLAGQAALAFGWTPAQFWTQTPAELAAVTAAHAAIVAGTAVPPPTPGDRAALMEIFPDG
ncbi:MAG: hypothetical protein RLZZ58_1910 [Pseudomonadota bacterium]